jgi:hypothetical protein
LFESRGSFLEGEAICGRGRGGTDPVKGVIPVMAIESEDVLERIRQELISIRKQGNKITERDLLRLSALTGIEYSTILRIEQEIS